MAKFYADAQGNILRLLKNERNELEFPDPPANTAFTLDFDPDTNTALLAAFDNDSNHHAMLGGVLTYNGTPVVIAADSTVRARTKDGKLAIQGLIDSLQTLKNDWAGLTAGARADALRTFALASGRVLLWLLEAERNRK